MNKIQIKLQSYAIEFVAYIIKYLSVYKRVKERNWIKNTILFGSVARENADKESDIDLFIDMVKLTKKEEKQFKNLINKILIDFNKSKDLFYSDINNSLSLKMEQLIKEIIQY